MQKILMQGKGVITPMKKLSMFVTEVIVTGADKQLSLLFDIQIIGIFFFFYPNKMC
jgi:hypothetical protein